MASTRFIVGVDIGGTFTDVVAMDAQTGLLRFAKVPTTPSDESFGILNGLAEVFGKRPQSLKEVQLIAHSTTIATNTVIEGKGARTGLITTKGFRDVLEIAREKRSQNFDVFEDKPNPLVPRHLRLEVQERMSYDGTPLVEPEKGEIETRVRELVESGIESIAVCFLHSFRNPSHELLATKVIESVSKSAFVSLSHEVLPEWREYERTSATVVNAYIQPRVHRYVQNLRKKLREEGYAGKLFIMQSSGGHLDSEDAERFPVRILESGPAAGVIAAIHTGKATGNKNLLSFDMGGTTAKCCVIQDLKPGVTLEFEVGGVYYKKGSGYPVRVPTTDLVEIGAGGGSIAKVEMGLLRVGPESAGAHPGPACYGAGGTEPTVTDADVVLGYLNPSALLGGAMRIYREKAEQAIDSKVAGPLSMSRVQAAAGIFRVVNANMANAMRLITVKRGIDPRNLQLVAFGGAGPVHASSVAKELGVKKIIVPVGPGVTSALGLLLANPRFDVAKTEITSLKDLDLGKASQSITEMKERARKLLLGTGVRNPSFALRVDMRYRGQGFELEVPVSPSTLSKSTLKESFERLYKETYGYVGASEIQVVTWRLTAFGTTWKPKMMRISKGTARRAAIGKRRIYHEGRFVEAALFQRERLGFGSKLRGPAVIEETQSTTVVLPGDSLSVDAFGNMTIEVA